MRAVLATVTVALVAVPSVAQCPAWDPRFSPLGADGVIHAMIVYDDGSGPALYVGGRFATVGTTRANFIAKWNGVEWSPLGQGLGPDATSTEVRALAVFDEGMGPVLFVGGSFATAGGIATQGIAKWNGTSWSSPGGGVSTAVNALVVYDDGNGAELYAGGTFTTAGGVAALRIARWNGVIWSALGTGTSGTVSALCVYDGGTGPMLCVGGSFSSAGGVSASAAARWNGTNWSALGSGLNASVRALAVFDNGTGAALYAGGDFTAAGGNGAMHVARWLDASGWSALPSDTNGTVTSLFVVDVGAGTSLYAGGAFTTAGGNGASHVARWDGGAWFPLDSGTDKNVNALAAFDDGMGLALYAGGPFAIASGAAASRVARWNGVTWTATIAGHGVDGSVSTFATYTTQTVTKLYAGGSFASAGGLASPGIARWDGSGWTSTGSGLGADGSTVRALLVFNDGSGEALFAGGSFSAIDDVPAANIAKWNGTSWTQVGLGLGPGPGVNALASFNDGTGAALYAGGAFVGAGGVGARYIAKWNGSAWSAFASEPSAPVNALAVFDDGTGSALYAGGSFLDAGGITVRFVAMWKSGAWHTLQSGLGSPVLALSVVDHGTGAALYAGGAFTSTAFGALTVGGIAKWDGATWSSLASGVSGGTATVRAIGMFDDGRGKALYAGGNFTTAGGVVVNSIARWNGASWSAVESGVGGLGPSVNAFATYQDDVDEAPDLYAGGSFSLAGGEPSFGFAQLHGCSTGTGYCFGDGSEPQMTSACPCGNYGMRNHGCGNSNPSLRGAHLFATGTTSPNTVQLVCEGVVVNSVSTFVRSFNKNAAGVLFGDGVCCVGPPLLRFGQQTSAQGGNSAFRVTVPAPTEAAGRTRYYFVHYRNTAATFCTPALFNASNGYAIEW